MGAIKEVFEDYKYQGDDVETAPDSFMDFLPSFPVDLKVGTLALVRGGVVLRFSGFSANSAEQATPIKPLANVY